VRQLVLGSLTALSLAACREPDESEKLALLIKSAAAEQAAARQVAAAPPSKHSEINPRLLRRFEPVRSQIETSSNSITNAKVELGRMLFFEKRLSRQQDLSCNSCHDLEHYGVDGRVTSPGTHGVLGQRNSPTVYNAAGFFVQFWDGRAPDVETQATGPILNPVEMSLPSEQHGVQVLESMPAYVDAFKLAFPDEKDPITFANLGRAIGAFERRLTTPSRWDDFLRGNESALTERELDGLKVFTNIGCMVCHTGEFVGGSMYQKVGVVEAWPNQKDQGRFETTKQDGDRMMFKVPTLRNIAKTAPYFHDGSAATLDVAVRKMGKHQLGLALSEQEVASIVAWLGSLTGELPRQYITPPELPPSTASTPGPLP
jgi:cytochrome c peroxidase